VSSFFHCRERFFIMCGALVLLALVALLPLVGAGGLVSRPAVPSFVVERLGQGCAPVPEARGTYR